MSSHQETQDIDQTIWSCIKESTHPQDFLDFIQNAVNTSAPHEAAFAAAVANRDHRDHPRLSHIAVQKLKALAATGNTEAMLNLGRWYRLGLFVPQDSETGLAWYREGAYWGSTRCMINLGAILAEHSPEAGVELLNQAIGLGDLRAHTYLANIEVDKRVHHLQAGSKAESGYSRYRWAYHCLKTADNAEEKARAIELIKEAAALNESSACLYLGLEYDKNKPHEDGDTSLQWLHKAMLLGNGSACAVLGSRLIRNKATKAQGLDYLLRAALLNEAYGQYALGKHYLSKGVTPEEKTLGLSWLRQAVVHGYRPAITVLAYALINGEAGEENPEEGLDLLQKGVQLGDAESQVDLACHYMSGRAVAQDKEKAHHLFNLASLQGNTVAHYFLGCNYANGDGTPADPLKAIACFREAADQGYAQAQFQLGNAYLYGEGVNVDIPTAAKWLRLAAQSNHQEAQFFLAMMFKEGLGVQSDTDRAHYWLDMASRQDFAPALRVLGLMLIDGDDLRQDQKEGKRLLAKAAALGDEEAQTWINEHFPQKPSWLKDLGKFDPLLFTDDELIDQA